mmetsp:Transcript_8912/g.36369  ORF Transcript_8912/g.36369 Transcript_8912/m.36369 type:complete len:205 (+) Transcript_8912:961-1575(+)
MLSSSPCPNIGSPTRPRRRATRAFRAAAAPPPRRAGPRSPLRPTQQRRTRRLRRRPPPPRPPLPATCRSRPCHGMLTPPLLLLSLRARRRRRRKRRGQLTPRRRRQHRRRPMRRRRSGRSSEEGVSPALPITSCVSERRTSEVLDESRALARGGRAASDERGGTRDRPTGCGAGKARTRVLPMGASVMRPRRAWLPVAIAEQLT